VSAPEGAATTLRAPSRRLLGVDAARGIALIGMMAIHIQPMLTADGSVSTAYRIASGRSAALFAVLAGVGLALASGGTTPPRGRRLAAAAAGTLARAGVLLLVGLQLGGLRSGVAVILVFYALLFVVAVPFLALPARVLLPLGAGWAVLAPLLSQAVRPYMPIQSFDSPAPQALANPVDLLREVAITGYYPVLTWTAYLLAGLGIGRLALGDPRVQRAVLLTGAALAVGAWLASWWLLHPGGVLHELEAAGAAGTPLADRAIETAVTTSFYGTTPTSTWWWLAVAAPHSGSPFDLLHTIGTSCVVLGAMLLLTRVAAPLLLPFAAIGSMTFTLYTLHVVLLSTALPRTVPDAFLWHVLIAMAIAVPWRGLVGRGPLEALAAFAARSAAGLVTDRPAIRR